MSGMILMLRNRMRWIVSFIGVYFLHFQTFVAGIRGEGKRNRGRTVENHNFLPMLHKIRRKNMKQMNHTCGALCDIIILNLMSLPVIHGIVLLVGRVGRIELFLHRQLHCCLLVRIVLEIGVLLLRRR